jgi:O-antigen ligase
VLLGLSGVVVATYVPDRTMERLATTGQQLEGGNLGGRFQIWMAGVHAFTQRPLMGYGTGRFIDAITPELGSKALVAHNSFLSVLVEEGLVGLILYMTMLLSVFYYVLHFPPFERRFGLVLLATLTTAMLPLAWEEKKVVWFVMAALVGMSIPMARREAVRQPLPQRAVPIGRSPVAARTMQRATSLGRGPDEGPAA